MATQWTEKLKGEDKEWKLEYIGILVYMVFVENIYGEVIKSERRNTCIQLEYKNKRI
jgi:hypothetical protein